MKTLKNQFGLVALAVAVLIVGFYFFGGDMRDEGIVVELGEETAEATENEGAQIPVAATPTKPKPAAPKPAASAPTPAPTPTATGLNGSTFRLSSYNGNIVSGSDVYTVTFKAGSGTFEDGFVTAKFCNTLTAPYRVTSGVMNANLAGTRAYCDEPKDLMDLEGAFSRLMGSSKMTLSGNSLTLSDNVKTMVFIRQ